MERIRAVLAILTAVVVVGWLVRTPADLDDLAVDDPPTATPDPTPTPSSTPGPTPSTTPTPTATPAPDPDAVEPAPPTAWRVERLDPTTLAPVVDLAPQPLDLHRVETGPGAPLLVSDAGSQAVVERVADLVTPPRRSLLLSGGTEEVAWVGAAGDWLAWATPQGEVTLAPLAGPDLTQRIVLPAPAEGLTVVDAALLSEARIALLAHDGGDDPLAEDGRAVLSVYVTDLGPEGRTRPTRLGDAPLAGRSALPQHAWDLVAGRLYVLDDVGGQLISVHLDRVGLSKRQLPVVAGPDDGVVEHDWRISAAAGQVVVSGVASVTRAADQPVVSRAIGLTTFDPTLRTLAVDPGSEAVRAAVSPDGTQVLTSSRVGRIQLLDDGLAVVSEHFAGGVLTDLEFGSGHAYAVRVTPTGRVLLAIDLATAEVVGSRIIGRDATFLPGESVLLTPIT